MAGTNSYSTTGIVARGRIYVAGNNKVYAFRVPGGTPTPTPRLHLRQRQRQHQRLRQHLPQLQRLHQRRP